jgi:hypothetical protein
MLTRGHDAAVGRPPRTPEESDGTAHLGLRVPVSLLRSLDAEAKAMQEERPGLKVSRTDVVQVLLNEALEARTKRRRKR